MNNWDETIILRKKFTSKNINEAKRNGKTEIQKKQTFAKNEHNLNNRMLDESTSSQSHEKVSFEISKLISRGRLNQKISQKDLAQKLCIKPSVINEYESGKAIPNKLLLSKIEKIIKIKLTGKNIGTSIN